MAIFEPKDTIDYQHVWDAVPGDITIVKGDPAIKQDVFGFWLKDCETITEEVCFIWKMRQVEAEKIVGTGEAILSGDHLYYIVAQKKVSPTISGTFGVDSYYCGTALRDAAASDTVVLMDFDGRRWDENV
jgi:hypothetical protein